MNISIDNKAGKTLLTQGKYCAEDIVVTPVLEEATVTPSTSAQSVTPGNGKAGLSKVTVGAIETEEKTVTSNGEVTPTSGKYLSKVTVSVPSTPTQEKAVTITENGTTEVTPDSGKALSKVTVTISVPVLDTSDATATADDILLGKTAYAKGEKLTGTIETYAGDGVETIDNKAGKTLLTQGKYCAENIVVTPVLEEVSITPTTAEQVKEPSTGKAGISKVTVSAIQTEEKTATPTTSKQDITPTSGKYLSKVTVGAIQTEEKTVAITGNGTTDVFPGSGKYLSKVTVTTNVPTSVIEAVSTAAEMNALLVAANVGKAYKFTGTTDSTYTNGDIYEVVQE